MQNDPLEPSLEPSTEHAPPLNEPVQPPTPIPTVLSTSVPPTEPPKKSRRTLWLVLGGVVIGAILVLAACGILGFNAVRQLGTAQTQIEQVLDEFMRDMESRDFEAAYALFSARSRRQAPITDIQKMGDGNNYVLFEGYEGLDVQNINVSATVQTDPNLPQGTVARVSGTTRYGSEFQGTFNGILEQEQGNWRIYNINLTVPPDKFKTTDE